MKCVGFFNDLIESHPKSVKAEELFPVWLLELLRWQLSGSTGLCTSDSHAEGSTWKWSGWWGLLW